MSWNLKLAAVSVLVSLGKFGLSMVIAGERNHGVRRLASPLLLASIVVLHLCGMTAASLTYDPRVALPPDAIPPSVIAPIIAAVRFGLLILAFMGLRMTMAAKARQRKDRERLRELASLAVEGLAVCDGGIITMANRSLERLSGIRGENLTGSAVSGLIPGLVLGPWRLKPSYCTIWPAIGPCDEPPMQGTPSGAMGTGPTRPSGVEQKLP